MLERIAVLVNGVRDVFVDLVREAEGVVLFAQVRDELHLLAAEHLPRRVVRIADDDGLCTFVEGSAQLFTIEDESVVGTVERDMNRLGVGEYRVRGVVLVERLEHDDLLARVHRSHHRGDHPLGGSTCDCDLGVRVDVHPEEPHRLFRDRVAELFNAPCDGVLVVVSLDSLHGFPFDVLRGGPVGEALAEIHGTILRRLAAHLADDRFGERARLPRDPVLGDLRLEHNQNLTTGMIRQRKSGCPVYFSTKPSCGVV